MGEGLAEDVLQRDLWEKSIRPPVSCDITMRINSKQEECSFRS